MEREEENPTSLTTPLNEHDIHDDDDDNDDDEDGGCRAVERERNRKEEIAKEVKKQLWLAGPLLGMASALDTLCGQSYGAEQYHMLGIHMQRAMLILSLVSIPLAIIWANTHAILVAFGQDHDISEEAQIYARFMIPSIFAYALLQCLVKFLQTQNIVFPMMISSGITTLIHLLVCWALVFKTDLGLRGAALANSISYWTNVVLLALYVKFSSSCAKTWTGLSKEALHDILNFLGLAIPSAVMVCLEMWSFEMIVLASGLLPDPELQTSVLSICLNTTTTVWMITYGLGNAVSTRVSNELGAGRPYAARLAVCVVLVMAVTEAVIVGAVMISIRNIWGYAYSDVVEVVRYVAAMMPILAASNFLDALQGVLSGTVRGCGRQKAGAFVNLGSYYIVGIPSAIVFAFVLRIGGKGLWFGIICGLIVQVLSLSTITLRTNWEQQAKKATERVYDSTIPVDTVS
ncbi:protein DETOXIFICATION 16-like isoform X2 [Camellia sinensis]|uniref:protein DETOXIFICATION 16-like isoform X2 n=1 Tax=Camellia sinensis TaxID=4442 RepID=UPI0010363EE2|nr:protein DETOXIFICATION 16-like isoform X2 [Camellia sinensis]